ncbi:MAG: radical SAM family heme chaperone HemW [Nitrospirae bacterium]|nr:radical SAM family heme chaperone HemW [Nitrospirota bacterium]
MPEFLYIHIPFCVRKCIYCDFLSLPYDESLALKYTDALCRELELKKNRATTLKTVFIGGGTPSVLPDSCLEHIFLCLRNNYSLTPSTEITVEANPGTITETKVDMLKSQGVNRVSLGIQSFQESELKTLGRIHGADEAISAAEMIISAGLTNLSLDLIYGIPGQTPGSWKDSLDRAIGLSPKHISAYELTPERGTQLYHQLESGSLTMPEEDLILDMNDLVIDILAAAGFEHYEISNFSLPGFTCIHNLNYWNRGEYLAAGAGAHSFVKGYRSRNTSDIRQYMESLSRELIPEIEKTEISCEDALKEFIFLGLRKTCGIRLNDAAGLGLNIAEAASRLIQAGFAEITSTDLRLTRKGLQISNTAIIELIENLGL